MSASTQPRNKTTEEPRSRRSPLGIVVFCIVALLISVLAVAIVRVYFGLLGWQGALAIAGIVYAAFLAIARPSSRAIGLDTYVILALAATFAVAAGSFGWDTWGLWGAIGCGVAAPTFFGLILLASWLSYDEKTAEQAYREAPHRRRIIEVYGQRNIRDECNACQSCQFPIPVSAKTHYGFKCPSCEATHVRCHCGNEFVPLPRVKLIRCPSCSGALNAPFLVGMVHRAEPYVKEDAHWDVFISYASEQTDLARHLAESLIRVGMRVWFADYEILLHNYPDSEFESALKRGLNQSRGAILLISEEFLRKEWTRAELQAIAEQPAIRSAFPFAVGIDPRSVAEQAPELASRQGRFWPLQSFVSVEHVLSVVIARADSQDVAARQLVDTLNDPLNSWDYTDSVVGFTLRLPGRFCRVKPLVTWPFRMLSFLRGRRVVEFADRDLGHLLNCIVGPIGPQEPLRHLLLPKFREGQTKSELLDHQREFCKEFSRDLLGSGSPFGLHRLRFATEKGAAQVTTHYAFSYVSTEGWLMRKYAVVFESPRTKVPHEAVFTVCFGSRVMDFWYFAEAVDQIVLSLRAI